MKHKIKTIFRRLYIRIKRLIDRTEYGNRKLDDTQRKAISICYKTISNPKSELLMSKLSDKRYVKLNDYFLIIAHQNIQIINHIYCYNISIDSKHFLKVLDAFDSKLENERLKMEAEVLGNVKHSLDIILENISAQ
jgi:hypothetical protein